MMNKLVCICQIFCLIASVKLLAQLKIDGTKYFENTAFSKSHGRGLEGNILLSNPTSDTLYLCQKFLEYTSLLVKDTNGYFACSNEAIIDQTPRYTFFSNKKKPISEKILVDSLKCYKMNNEVMVSCCGPGEYSIMLVPGGKLLITTYSEWPHPSRCYKMATDHKYKFLVIVPVKNRKNASYSKEIEILDPLTEEQEKANEFARKLQGSRGTQFEMIKVFLKKNINNNYLQYLVGLYISTGSRLWPEDSLKLYSFFEDSNNYLFLIKSRHKMKYAKMFCQNLSSFSYNRIKGEKKGIILKRFFDVIFKQDRLFSEFIMDYFRVYYENKKVSTEDLKLKLVENILNHKY